MRASVSASSLYLTTNPRSLRCRRHHHHLHRFHFSISKFSHPILFNHFMLRSPRSSRAASIAARDLQVSWFPSETTAEDDCNGWAIVESPTEKKKKGLPTFLLIGMGTSIAALIGVFAYLSLSRRGFEFQLNNPLRKMSMPSGTDERHENQISVDSSAENSMISEGITESVPDAVDETVTSEINLMNVKEEKPGRIIIPAAVDSTQREALSILKKLKIIEDDVKANELCTRREYARWLVRSNLLLERNPNHRIAPSIALSGSAIAAFDDVDVDDPDFESVQSLAEAGIILSKLSGPEGQEAFNFSPDRFISRQDLISWRAKLEYGVVRRTSEEISRTNLGFMDIREISSHASEELFTDMMTGDKSIIRKVFGQSKRFQPNKPSTKAQAGVALTSGRLSESIHSELLRLKAESLSRQAAMEEIRHALLERGDIQRFWDQKKEEEKKHGLDAEKAYVVAINDLEDEKIVEFNTKAVFLKKRAALDCQKQLLSRLKEEVNEMSERFAREWAEYTDDQHSTQELLREWQVKYEEKLDAKSILEAEIEALRILRSWIEDEARKSQARAKVLKEVGQRWKWGDRR